MRTGSFIRICFLLLFLLPVRTYAQFVESIEVDEDFFKKKPKKSQDGSKKDKPSSPSTPGSSVVTPGTKVASSNSVTIAAVGSNLVLLREQYRLQQGKDFFGANGNDWFGETFTLGVKSAGGMYLLDRVVEPWKADDAYQRVNASGNYKPVHFWTYGRCIEPDTTLFEPINLEVGSRFTQPVCADSTLYFHQEARSDFGLSVDSTAGFKDGIMLWVQSTTTPTDSAMHFTFVEQALGIEVGSVKPLQPVSVPQADKVVGGVFVYPRHTPGGLVQFMLVGIAVRDAKGGWALQLLSQNYSPKVGGKAKNAPKLTPSASSAGSQDAQAKAKDKPKDSAKAQGKKKAK